MSARNRWLDDDDIVPVAKGTNRWNDEEVPEDFDPNKDYFQQVVQKKQNNMVESTQRSLAMLAESETVGAATGEELVRQGEVLRRTEKRVDKMENDLKESDRHLRSIKSIWGAFRNKFSKEPPPPKPTIYEESDGKNKSNLRDVIGQCDNAIDARRDASGHPVLNRQDESRQMYSGGMQEDVPQNSANKQVDENLDLMGQSLARLKNLGIEMQNEIEDQDPIIERLGGKVHRVDDKLHATNKQMIKLNNS